MKLTWTGMDNLGMDLEDQVTISVGLRPNQEHLSDQVRIRNQIRKQRVADKGKAVEKWRKVTTMTMSR